MYRRREQLGASCLAVESAGQGILVDAGVRVDRKSDPLPDLALLEGKDVRAIFVTHAHADHIGALPLVHQAFPLAPHLCLARNPPLDGGDAL